MLSVFYRKIRKRLIENRKAHPKRKIEAKVHSILDLKMYILARYGVIMIETETKPYCNQND